MAIPVVQDLAEMYRECDPAASMNLLARLAVEKSLNSKLEDCRLGLQVGLRGRVHTDWDGRRPACTGRALCKPNALHHLVSMCGADS